MNKHLHICYLIDFYGQLLTKKQYEILDMYYNNDYSLSEIAQILKVSRQAVNDIKSRALDSLHKYETMLGLIRRFVENKQKLKSVHKELDDIKTKAENDQVSSELQKVIDEIDAMIREL